MDDSPQKAFHSLSETEAQSGLSVETEKNVHIEIEPRSAGTSTAPGTPGDDSDSNYSKLKESRNNVIICAVIAAIFAIPLIVFTTARKNATIGKVPTSGLVLWLLVGWCTICLTAVFSWAVKMLWKMCFDVLEDPLKAPLSAFIGDVEDAADWSVVFGVLYGVSDSCLCWHYSGKCEETWVRDFKKALLATLVICLIVLAKTLVMEAIYLRNAWNSMESRSVRPLRAWKALLETLEARTQDEYLKRVRKAGRSAWIQPQYNNDRFLALYQRGVGEDDFYERVGCLDKALQQWNKDYAGQEIDLEEVYEQLRTANYDRRYNGDAFRNDQLSREDFMDLFDTDRDGNVTLAECGRIYLHEIVPFFRDCNKSVLGIKKAMQEVNRVLLVVLVPIAAVIYAAFFVSDFAKYATPLWTTLTGLSFAISGTVTSFIASCTFVFGKQPFDVGDRVLIVVNGKEEDLIVHSIRLHFTVFCRLQDSTMLQVSHQTLDGCWIKNLSRSADLQPSEERLVTVTRDRLIEKLGTWQAQLREQVVQDEQCRRHLDADHLALSRPTQADEGDHLCRVTITFAYQKRMIRREGHLAKCRDTVWRILQELMKDEETA